MTSPSPTLKRKAAKALCLKTDGTLVHTTTKHIQKHVEGYFEALPPFPGKTPPVLTAYVNEEGVMKQLPSNPFGLFLEGLRFYVNWEFGGVYGNVVLTGGVDEEGYDTDLPKYIADAAKTYIQKYKA